VNGIGFFKRLLGQAASDEAPARTRAGTRMLVVDDSPTIRAVLGKMLGQEGYEVLKAGDGSTALELARHEQPALIFLDIVMPGMSGFAVLRTLRHDSRTRHIPIVMISGNPQATEQFYVQRFGADDFMRKPFGRDEIRECIGQLVRSGRLPARLSLAIDEPSPPVLDEVAVAADIPDIAMPDPEATMPLVAPLAPRLPVR